LRRFLFVARGENDQRTLEAGVLRARDDLIEIVREFFIGEMTVAVDHRAIVASGSRAAP
jgi:hypothetical protein